MSEPAKAHVSLPAARFSLAEHARYLHHADVPAGTSSEALMEPGYWRHVTGRLKKGGRIEALAEDGSYFAELLILDAGKSGAVVTALRVIDLAPVDSTGDVGAFDFRFVQKLGWTVVRKADKERVSQGHGTEAEARKWAADNGGKV